MVFEGFNTAFHRGGGFGCCLIYESSENGHLGGRLVCNYGGYTLGSFVEAWESKGGLDSLRFFVLVAL